MKEIKKGKRIMILKVLLLIVVVILGSAGFCWYIEKNLNK